MKRIATIYSLLIVAFLVLSCNFAIAIDTTPPVTTADPPEGGYIYGGMLSLSCSDGSGSGCKATYYCFSYGGDCTPTEVYVSPFYLQDGTLNYYSIDNAGNSEAVKSNDYQGMPAFNDFDPPVTTANPASGSYTIASGSSQIVTLSCDDSGAPYSNSFPTGCMGTYYCLGNGCNPTNVYNGGIPLNASQTVRYYSNDLAYNQEYVQEQTYTIIIDTTTPATTVNPAGGLYNSAKNLALACNDGSGTGCKTTHYCLGTGCTPNMIYSSAIPIISSQTLRYSSVDNAGNSEAVTSQSYIIDTTPPVTTVNLAGGLYNSAQNVTLVCNDGNGCNTTYFCLGTGCTPNMIYSSAISVISSQTLRYFSVDNAGNSEAVTSQSYNIDTAPPATTVNSAGVFYNSAQNVTLACNDGSGSGCKTTYYCLGTACTPTTVYSSAIPISTTQVVYYYSVDNFGNSEAVKSKTYIIDNTPPVTNLSPTGGNYSKAQFATLSCSDDSTGCQRTYYCFGTGCTPTTSFSLAVPVTPILISTNVTLRYFSIDGAGNNETITSQTYNIGVDTTAPITTAIPVGGIYNSAQNVALSCGDGNGSGCQAIYYCLGSGCTPTTVYSSAIPISASQTVRYYSVDNDGNNEPVTSQTYNIAVDATAPITSAIPVGGIYSSAQNVALACGDGNGSGCQATYYCLGSGCTPTTVYSSAIPISDSQTVRYYSVDNDGNNESVASQTYTLAKPGDCDASGTVTIAEVQTAINMFLGTKAITSCVDTSGDNSVSIAEVQKVINGFLGL